MLDNNYNKYLKILIDITSIYGRNITGIEILAMDLYKTLSQYQNIKINKVVRCKNIDNNCDNTLILKSENRVLVEQLLIPIALRKVKSDLAIFPAFPPGFLNYLLKQKTTKTCVVIHDTVPWKYYETLSLNAKIYLKPLFDAAIKKADFILTVSETVKKELEDSFNLKNVFCIGNKISEIYNMENVGKTTTDILERLNISKDSYLLSVSTLEPRKNFKYLLRIYGNLVRCGLDKKLVLVGRKGWDKEVLDIIDKFNIKDNVIYTGYISDEDLITLYKNSYSFILLSKYEGFGRPPLEALACGTRVIVSDIPIFRDNLEKLARNHTLFVPLGNEDMASSIIINDLENIQKNEKIDIYSTMDENFKENLVHFLKVFEEIKDGKIY